MLSFFKKKKQALPRTFTPQEMLLSSAKVLLTNHSETTKASACDHSSHETKYLAAGRFKVRCKKKTTGVLKGKKKAGISHQKSPPPLASTTTQQQTVGGGAKRRAVVKSPGPLSTSERSKSEKSSNSGVVVRRKGVGVSNVEVGKAKYKSPPKKRKAGGKRGGGSKNNNQEGTAKVVGRSERLRLSNNDLLRAIDA